MAKTNNNEQKRRRGRRRPGRRSEPPPPKREINAGLPDEVKYRMPPPPPRRDYGACPICSQPMRDINSAIAFPPSNEPAHFECVLRNIAATEDLAQGERVCYLGNGSFGIIADKSKAGESRYVIRKRIQFEDAEGELPWRKELSPGISRE